MPDSNESEGPEVLVWNQDGRICLSIKNATIMEHEGKLVAGMAFTPLNAINVARVLLNYAIEYVVEETDEDDH